jgi:hypothetical protein
VFNSPITKSSNRQINIVVWWAKATKENKKASIFWCSVQLHRVAILFVTTGECKMIVLVWGVKSAKILLVGDK